MLNAIIIVVALLFGVTVACSQPITNPVPEPAPAKQGTETRTPAPVPAEPDPVTAPPAPVIRGTIDPNISGDVYEPQSVYHGTILLGDNYFGAKPRILELNLLGEIMWQYEVPNSLRRPGPAINLGINPGFDVELVSGNNILFVSAGSGVYEIDRQGNAVWSYLNQKVSHDADRLPNGNTLIVFGDNDQKSDAQIKEVNPRGEIIWSWYARDYFDKPPYSNIYIQGWTHTNAVSRLPNGNTMISLRNFNLIVEVDPQGKIVRTIGEGIFDNQHDPVMLPNGNILVANHNMFAALRGEKQPQRAIEIEPDTGKIVWQFIMDQRTNWPVRDVDKLPNGNTLIVGSTKIIEVTPAGKIVWWLKYNKDFESKDPKEYPMRGFYKAQRIGISR